MPTEKFNLEIINEIKRIEEIEKNVDRDKMVYNQLIEIMILEVLKQYTLMVMILETMLLVSKQRILNKQI